MASCVLMLAFVSVIIDNSLFKCLLNIIVAVTSLVYFIFNLLDLTNDLLSMKREVKRLKQEKRLNRLNPKHHELKWYTDKNPFYYILNITYDEKYRTLTRLTIND